MSSMIYEDQEKNRTFILVWDGINFTGKPIDLLVEANGQRNLVGKINSKEELEQGREFDYQGQKIFVQHKKVFLFIKELFLSVDGTKISGRSL
ncbi:MAG: hypothetical protein US58_C0041G0004 [Candidatus Magasanikbacteria bacterium GW2011_GWA2_37_8]|uniref:Uncharacterized protein n=1 Tax=Candidatus Magasanikbacteria bacterium GW2011_GWA2_37_8 TaxID=1619036 RepID=A0A0G0KEX2_9BACT|nr:MAG: hypothetical protein US58_C0041G0004 [Candidatus Magasanikbacteria bacterium GW2011_GWA2_37_8]